MRAANVVRHVAEAERRFDAEVATDVESAAPSYMLHSYSAKARDRPVEVRVADVESSTCVSNFSKVEGV